MLATLLFFVIISYRIIKLNGPAEASVIFRPFNGGINDSAVYGEGLYLIWPWNTAYKFSVREHVVNDTLSIMASDGVTVTVRINYRYYPIKNKLPVIFRRYGVNYGAKFVRPEVTGAIREEISGMSPKDIYSVHLKTLDDSAVILAQKELDTGYVKISDLMYLDIALPKKVVDAIEEKLREEQLVQQYEFKKKVAILESQAIRIAQDTISKGLTPAYLQFKQIEAFQKLSLSPNAKTIVIPQGGKNPILINGQ